MTSAEPQTLVLVGPMGAGKTSIGKRVAKHLGTTFTDTDAAIVRAHGPIPQLFVSHGEGHFRAIERDVVAASLRLGGVVSLGGGSILDEHTRDDLQAHRVVFLTVEPRVIAGRLGEGGTKRPLLAGDEDPVTRWTRIFEERRPLYEAVADLTVDTSSGPLDRIAESIAEWASTEGAKA